MDLIAQMRAKIKGILDQRAQKQEEMDAVIASAEERDDGNLTDEETERLQAARSAIAELDEQRAAAEQRLAELEADAEARKAAEEARQRYEQAGDAGQSHRVGNVSVREELVYRPEGRHSFFSDAFRAARGHDFGAQDRLRQHQRQMEELGAELRDGDPERRDVGTGAFGSLVVPQYLVDEFAPVLRNSRATANAVRGEDLPPEGMTVTIPRGESGVSVAPQATENTGVSETDADFDNDLTINVRTFSGQQDVSRQSLERGTPGLDRLLYDDLVGAYGERLNSSIIADDGTSGTHEGLLESDGVNAVTYTDTNPTVAEIWPKISDAVQQVATNRKRAANLIVMHPRRWGWFTAALDDQNRPLVYSGDPARAFNALGLAPGDGGFGEGQLVGTLQNIAVLVDAGIPTNLGTGTDEDRIIVLRRQDPILWEEMDGMPRELRFEETLGGNLTVKLVVYGYSAFTAERYPEAVSIVSGTGLVAPTF